MFLSGLFKMLSSSSSSKLLFERFVLKILGFSRGGFVLKYHFCYYSGQPPVVYQILSSIMDLFLGIIRGFWGSFCESIYGRLQEQYFSFRDSVNDNSLPITSFQISLYDCIQVLCCYVVTLSVNIP